MTTDLHLLARRFKVGRPGRAHQRDAPIAGHPLPPLIRPPSPHPPPPPPPLQSMDAMVRALTRKEEGGPLSEVSMDISAGAKACLKVGGGGGEASLEVEHVPGNVATWGCASGGG
jgi:hypothetical protein